MMHSQKTIKIAFYFPSNRSVTHSLPAALPIYVFVYMSFITSDTSVALFLKRVRVFILTSESQLHFESKF
jgi:hypothetical protein